MMEWWLRITHTRVDARMSTAAVMWRFSFLLPSHQNFIHISFVFSPFSVNFFMRWIFLGAERKKFLQTWHMERKHVENSKWRGRRWKFRKEKIYGTTLCSKRHEIPKDRLFLLDETSKHVRITHNMQWCLRYNVIDTANYVAPGVISNALLEGKAKKSSSFCLFSLAADCTAWEELLFEEIWKNDFFLDFMTNLKPARWHFFMKFVVWPTLPKKTRREKWKFLSHNFLCELTKKMKLSRKIQTWSFNHEPFFKVFEVVL